MKYTKRALLVFVLLAFMYGYYYQDPGANGNSRMADPSLHHRFGDAEFLRWQPEHIGSDVLGNVAGFK
jgi:hypothetical protein